jgi:uncharacterized membrane protein SpoIIM required for sporulation
MNKHFSKVGLGLALLYVLLSLACVALSLASEGDPKGKFVLLQLPIAAQIALLHELGFGRFLAPLGWVAGYILLGIPTVVFLYFLGKFLGKLLPD